MAVGDAADGDGHALTIDCMSPYYIQSGDKPGDVFVTSLLRDGNYGDWLDEMSNALYAKNKFGFVNGDLPMPEAKSPYLPYWQRANAMVKGWLNSSMELELRQSVKFKTAREIWTDLEERFGKESAPRAYELRCSLGAVRQDNQSVSAYFSRLRKIWDEMASITKAPTCDCGKCTCNLVKRMNEIRDREHLYDFLMGLDDYYASLKSQILATRPIPTLTFAYHLISEGEQHRNIASTRKSGLEGAAFQTQGKPLIDGGRKVSNKDGRFCTHCGKTNHSYETCFEIVGYPANWNVRGKDTKPHSGRQREGRPGEHHTRSTDRGISQKRGSQPKAAHVDFPDNSVMGLSSDQLQRLAEFMRLEFSPPSATNDTSMEGQVNMAGKQRFTPSWIIDSGASEHITCDSARLSDLIRNSSESPVRIPNGLSLEEADWGG
ncbi:unnamed protein product [Cuscuta epithymum]|uniref:Retrotransposon Copia-like N-terminal domain-containing protein n=1 Tax=Cuscuta epithymum TaxID=186058 RepID=A0AAV0GE37_9ASTE|nr:unnamed protein product [Cuscuta epithymum]